MSTTKIGQVLTCAPDAIVVLVEQLKVFEEHKEQLQVGRYLKIAQGNSDFTVAVIRNIKGMHALSAEGAPLWQFLIECQAIGTLIGGTKFQRASLLLPVPTEEAFAADSDTLYRLFAEDADHRFPLGELSQNAKIKINVDGDCFFSKHIAVVGSTGSGKSCAVAKILHSVVGVGEAKYENIGKQNNSHVVIFDIHDEYAAAFSLKADQQFTLNRLDIETLSLPYWLMNSEELESMFIESNEANSHNQISQFKQAVIRISRGTIRISRK